MIGVGFCISLSQLTPRQNGRLSSSAKHFHGTALHVICYEISIESLGKISENKWSDEDFFDRSARYISEPEVASAVVESQALVIEAQTMENGRVDIVRARGFHGAETKFVSGSVGRAALHSSARQPDRESERIVIAAVLQLCAAESGADFDNRRPAEFRPMNTSVSLSMPRDLRSLINAAMP